MPDWKEYRLGDLIEYRKGFAFKSSLFGSNGVMVVRVSDTTSDSIDTINCPRIETELTSSFDSYRIKYNDIIISTVGSWPENPNSIVGKVIKVPKEADNALLNQNTVRLRAINRELQLFLYYRLKCQDFSDYLISGAQGSANQASINLYDIFDFKIKLNDKEYNDIVANILSSLDYKIDLLHRQNKTLEALAETLFRQWFIEEAEEGWEVGTMDDVVSMKGGTTPSTNEPIFWDGMIHWTSPRDLSSTASIFLFDTSRKITEEGLRQISSGLLPVGTLLLSSRAPIGYLAITEIPVAINQGYIAIICDKLFSNYYMFLWCKANMETIENAGNGSVFQEISKSAFKTLELVIPPMEKLMHFDTEIEPMFQKIKSNTYQIRTLTKLRDTLLPKLMSGEVRVEY